MWPLLQSLALRAIGVFFFAVFAQGLLLYLASKDIHPANWIAGLLELAEYTLAVDGVWWMIVGFSGLVGLFIVPPFYALGRRKFSRDSAGTRPKPNSEPSVETEDADFINLPEAARRAYEETEGTLVGYAAETHWTGGSRDVLSYYAIALCRSRNKISLFGKSPPSRVLREIPEWEINQSNFSDDVSVLIRRDETNPAFVDLHVRKDDFIRKIAEIKTWNDEQDAT